NHRARKYGKSKYGIGRTFKVLLDLATLKFLSGYVTKPIYVFGGWGLALAVSGTILTAVVAVQKPGYGTFVHRIPLAWSAGLCFMPPLQFLLMGLLAELIVRPYHESQGKSIYVIRQVINLGTRADDSRRPAVRVLERDPALPSRE